MEATADDAGGPNPSEQLHRRRTVAGIVAGSLAALLVALVGVALIATAKHHWSAKTTVVVLPSSGLDPGAGASYYDTLSHGQITSTVAAVLGLGSYKSAAADAVGLSPAERSQISITATAITNTALVTVTATAPTAQIATEMADGVVAQSERAVDQLVSPYAVSVVSQAGNTASQSSNLSLGKFLVVLLVVAIALGVGVQQAAMQLISLLWRRRAAQAEVPFIEPAVDPVVEDMRAWTEFGRPRARPNSPAPSPEAAERAQAAVPNAKRANGRVGAPPAAREPDVQTEMPDDDESVWADLSARDRYEEPASEPVRTQTSSSRGDRRQGPRGRP